MRAGFSEFSSGFIRLWNFPEPGLAWPPCNALSTGMPAAFGRRPRWGREQYFILLYRAKENHERICAHCHDKGRGLIFISAAMKVSNQPLHVLIVEDSENDALLLEIALQRAGYDPVCVRVERPEDLDKALSTQTWDVVIADY